MNLSKSDIDSTAGESGETPSEVSASLTLLQGAQAFEKHLQRICASARRQIHILSSGLDTNLFGSQHTCHLLSKLARRHPQTEIFILLKEPGALFGHRHRLLELQQRLPSKIHLRQLKLEPEVDKRAYVIVDEHQLLLQHDAHEYDGFCDTSAAVESLALLQVFRGYWQCHSGEITEFRRLAL